MSNNKMYVLTVDLPLKASYSLKIIQYFAKDKQDAKRMKKLYPFISEIKIINPNDYAIEVLTAESIGIPPMVLFKGFKEKAEAEEGAKNFHVIRPNWVISVKAFQDTELYQKSIRVLGGKK